MLHYSHRPESATLQRIQQGSHELLVELLSVGSQWVELAATPTHQAELASFGLSGCEQVADLAELFAAELVEHWATLNHANRALQYSLENHAHNSLEGHTHHSHVGHTNQSVEDHDYQSHEGHTHKGIDGHTRQRLRRGLAPADRSDEEQDWFSSYVSLTWFLDVHKYAIKKLIYNNCVGHLFLLACCFVVSTTSVWRTAGIIAWLSSIRPMSFSMPLLARPTTEGI